MNGPANGEYIASEFYLRSPSSVTTINYVLFLISFTSFGLTPHIMQRMMAAEYDSQVRIVTMVLAVSPFISQLPGVLIGISFLSNVNSLESPLNEYPAFQSTLGLFQSEGGFREFISYIAMLGAVAGIMSTADSAVIGVSNTFVVDIFKHWLTPQMDQKYIVWIGKAVSLVTVSIAVGVAIHLESQAIKTGESVSYGVLLTVQQAILWQSFPAYVFGLYTNISWKSVLSGLSAGILLEVILMVIVSNENNPFIMADPLFEILDPAWSAFCGVGLNLIVCLVAHLILGGDNNEIRSIGTMSAHDEDEEDDDESAALSIDQIREIIKGFDEPITKYYGIFVYLAVICTLISAFHWIGPVDPELTEIYDKEGVRHLFYNGYVENVIGGFPSWAFSTMMWYGVATIFAIYATYLWTTDNVKDDDDIPMAESETLNTSVNYTNGVSDSD